MALSSMKKVKEPDGKMTLPSATVTGYRKKAPKYPIVQKGKTKYQVISKEGDTTEYKKQDFEKIIGKNQ